MHPVLESTLHRVDEGGLSSADGPIEENLDGPFCRSIGTQPVDIILVLPAHAGRQPSEAVSREETPTSWVQRMNNAGGELTHPHSTFLQGPVTSEDIRVNQVRQVLRLDKCTGDFFKCVFENCAFLKKKSISMETAPKNTWRSLTGPDDVHCFLLLLLLLISATTTSSQTVDANVNMATTNQTCSSSLRIQSYCLFKWQQVNSISQKLDISIWGHGSHGKRQESFSPPRCCGPQLQWKRQEALEETSPRRELC